MPLWKLCPESLAAIDSPLTILTKYAAMLSPDTGDKLRALVYTNKTSLDVVSYSFYVTIPGNTAYAYKLFDVNLDSALEPYPLTMKHYVHTAILPTLFRCLDSKEFEKDLVSAVGSVGTQNVLAHIEYLIDK